MPSAVVKRKPTGLLGPGASQRAIRPATKPMMMIQRMPIDYLLSSGPAAGFLLARDPAFRCEGIDGARKMLFQFGEDAISGYAGPLRQSVERIGPDGLLEIFRRDGTVRTRAYPGLGNLTLAGLLKLLDQLTEAAAQDAAGSAAGNHLFQSGQPI